MSDAPKVSRRPYFTYLRVLYGVGFLWATALGWNSDARDWVVRPLLTFAAVCIFAEYMGAKFQFGRKLAILAVILIFGWFAHQSYLKYPVFPRTIAAVKSFFKAKDVETASKIRPPLGDIRVILDEYIIAVDDEAARRLKRELNDLYARWQAGTISNSQRISEEKRISAEVEEMARSRPDLHRIIQGHWPDGEPPHPPPTTTTVSPPAEAGILQQDKNQPQQIPSPHRGDPLSSPSPSRASPAASVHPEDDDRSFWQTATSVGPSVLIAMRENGRLQVDSEATGVLARMLKAQQNPFGATFLKSGVFDRVLSGEMSRHESPIEGPIIIGLISTNYEMSRYSSGLIEAEAEATIRILKRGKSDIRVLRESGAGTSNRTARADAIRKVSEAIAETIDGV
jgi:hypothetical protein